MQLPARELAHAHDREGWGRRHACHCLAGDVEQTLQADFPKRGQLPDGGLGVGAVHEVPDADAEQLPPAETGDRLSSGGRVA